MRDTLLALAVLALDWLGDHWFQTLEALFMLRVWVGLSALTRLAERVYLTFSNDPDADVLRALYERRLNK
jgi:hypothetical protein